MGRAILDYVTEGKTRQPLLVKSSIFEDDEMPIPHLFRTYTGMPVLERHALDACRGRVLDVGAGAGCHSLALQKRGIDVTAIDISPLSVEAMCMQGIRQVYLADIMGKDADDRMPKGAFDTILLLMNGLGIAGKAPHLPYLLERLKKLLAPRGQILTDGTDLRYIFEDEDGHFDPKAFDGYYGEVDFQMTYGNIKGRPFDWLYADYQLVEEMAMACGLRATCVERGEHYDYLARLSKCAISQGSARCRY